MHTLLLISLPKLSSIGWFSFLSAFDSCHQLLTAVDSWWQLIWMKFDSNFHVHSIGDIFAKFQLSRLIFIFISFWQLLSAVKSWWQLSRKKLIGIFIYPLNVIFMPNFSSLGCLAAELESVTPPPPPDGCRRMPGENRANPGIASLVLGPELSNYIFVSFWPMKTFWYSKSILS